MEYSICREIDSAMREVRLAGEVILKCGSVSDGSRGSVVKGDGAPRTSRAGLRMQYSLRLLIWAAPMRLVLPKIWLL